MNFRRAAILSTAAAFAMISHGGFLEVQAATFDITYDDADDGGIGGTIIGSGSLSYDGPIVLGEFPLDGLTGLQFSAEVGGVVFDTADIATELASSNLLVFNQSGKTIATFTGMGGIPAGGSFDLVAPGGEVLSHEPGPAGNPCCGGTDVARLFAAQPGGPSLIFGNYQLVAVPEPAAATITIAALVLASVRSRRPGGRCAAAGCA